MFQVQEMSISSDRHMVLRVTWVQTVLCYVNLVFRCNLMGRMVAPRVKLGSVSSRCDPEADERDILRPVQLRDLGLVCKNLGSKQQARMLRSA